MRQAEMALRRLTPSQMPLLMDALEEKARPGMKFATVLEWVYQEHLTGVPGEVTAMLPLSTRSRSRTHLSMLAAWRSLTTRKTQR